ncbi:hypothetical protein [Leptospira sarikeiensis]|uniref:Alpha/beta hydrolase n=1 Tax=Leptospira sarikeiensis TaxID=2484943 RepID=A0A4R9KE45_9LEPT|nr:hypothetical protein [Leptospira sarikeiensis]TGL64129.1 hypothetical protein EHQ64_03830 [Leptospira sarikeiensis]
MFQTIAKPYLFRLISFLFIPLLFSFCANEAFVEFKPNISNAPCDKTWKSLDHLCEEDLEDLSSGSTLFKNTDPWSIDSNILQGLLKGGNSVDSLSVSYYHAWENQPISSKILQFLAKRKKEKLSSEASSVRKNYFVGIIPGMFYKDNPVTGADGGPVREILKQAGIPNGNIDIDQIGTLEENANEICKFIKNYDRSETLILYSTSKGGSDFKYSVSKCGKEPYFLKVKAWLNVAGLLKGTPLMTNRTDTWLKRFILRIGIPLYGYRFDSLFDLRRGEEAPLDADVNIPNSLYVLNIIGIPMARHVSFRGFPNFTELAIIGPNDGLTLLPDSLQKGGDVLPLWGNDHYFLKFRDPALFLSVLDWIILNIEKK